jgi:hypothetical protein
MPWIMGVATGLLSWRNGFDSRAVHIGFVVNKVALGQIRLPVIWFYHITIIPPLFHAGLLIRYGRCILAIYSVYVCNTHAHTCTHILGCIVSTQVTCGYVLSLAAEQKIHKNSITNCTFLLTPCCCIVMDSFSITNQTQ